MSRYKTRKIQQDDPSIDAENTPIDMSGYHQLSYLAGSITHGGTNDVGDVAGNAPWEYDPAKSRAREFLLRHTVEPGLSTFSWPQKP